MRQSLAVAEARLLADLAGEAPSSCAVCSSGSPRPPRPPSGKPVAPDETQC
ncbi:hypothetical protein [Streptomyces sp. NPDC052302]|uniref:hypothetical protein n=1 Tax=unclassified Streptomyces TaxID=2593676 RepID=UPI0037D3404E